MLYQRHNIRASHKKNCAHNKSKKTKKPEDEHKFKKIRNQLKNLVSKKYKDYIKNITEHMGVNPKRFWTLLKDRRKSKTSPSVITDNGIDTTDPDEKSTIFNKYFQSVFTSVIHNNPPPIHQYPDPELENVTITSSEVERELKNLNPTKAAGPDNIPTRVLKECATQLASPVASLFNNSIQSGSIPAE